MEQVPCPWNHNKSVSVYCHFMGWFYQCWQYNIIRYIRVNIMRHLGSIPNYYKHYTHYYNSTGQYDMYIFGMWSRIMWAVIAVTISVMCQTFDSFLLVWFCESDGLNEKKCIWRCIGVHLLEPHCPSMCLFVVLFFFLGGVIGPIIIIAIFQYQYPYYL